MKGLTDIPGILVGHATNREARTGCTVILCEKGAAAGIDVRGGASETDGTGILSALHVTDRLHGVLLTGGSAFGLEATSGVRKFLEKRGAGFRTSGGVVPIVAGAVLYDLSFAQRGVRPTREMGEAAAAAATADAVEEGAVGAGTGATVGKVLGMKQAMKSGIGSATVTLSGAYSNVRVAALAAVNAVGDVIDPSTGRIVAGARTSSESRDFADAAKVIKAGGRAGFQRENTTLVVVATNASLTKVGATKLAQLASLGMARSISPVNMTSDGDLVIALSAGEEKADVNALGVAAAEAVAEAILRAVRMAPSVGGVPGLKDAEPRC